MAADSTEETDDCSEKTNMTEDKSTLSKQLADEINLSGFSFIFAEREPVIRR